MTEAPRRRRNLFLLWLAQFVLGTGDSVFSVSIGFLVIYMVGREAGVEFGLTRMMDALPFLVFGAYACVLVDCFSRRGTLNFEHAQQTSSANTTGLLTGSWARLSRIS